MKHAPNILTILRILSAPLLYYLIMDAGTSGEYLFCYYLFVVSALTDVYDGLIARHSNAITTFGKVVDPVADKFLLAGALIPFYLFSGELSFCRFVTLPMVLVILGRELVITILRYTAMWRGTKIISASRIAKFKTAFQMFFIGSMLVRFYQWQLQETRPDAAFSWFNGFHDYMNMGVLWLIVVISIISGVDYLIRNVPLLVRKAT